MRSLPPLQSSLTPLAATSRNCVLRLVKTNKRANFVKNSSKTVFAPTMLNASSHTGRMNYAKTTKSTPNTKPSFAIFLSQKDTASMETDAISSTTKSLIENPKPV